MENYQTPIVDNIDWNTFAGSFLPYIEEGIAALDKNGRILFCNASFLALAQKSAQQLQGQVLEMVFDEQPTAKWNYSETATKDVIYQQQAFQIKLIPSFTTSQEQTGCAAIIKKINFGSTAHPISDLETLTQINQQLLNEVQARKNLQAQLQESQYFIKQVADASPDVLYVYDLQEKRTIYINREIYNKLGYTPEEFYALGNHATQTISHPDDLTRRIAHFEAIKDLKDGEILEIEYRVRHVNGEWLWVHTRDTVFKRTPEGIPCLLIGVSQNITQMKRAEARLLESQHFERYRSLIIASSSIVWLANSKGEMREENKQWEQFTGQTFEQYRNMGWLQAILPADRVTNRLLWNNAFIDKVPVDTECRLLHHSGQYRYMAVRAVPIIGQQGDVKEWIGTCTDIHDRKVAEEAHRKSEERYEIAASVTHDAIWDWNLLTNELTHTSGYYYLFGFSEAEVQGTIDEWYSHIHPDDAEQVIKSIHAVILSGKTLWTSEYRHMRKDGSIAYVYDRGYVQHDATGKPVRMVGAMADITERKLAEDALRRNEEQLRLITDSLPVLISYIDAGERYQFINKTYEEWFNISTEQAHGMHMRELLGQQAYAALKPHVATALQGKQVTFETFIDYNKAGQRSVNATYIPHAENGIVKGFYVLVLDITEQKKVQQKLTLSEERFRLVSMATNDVIWDWDLMHHSIWWNEGIRALFGYKPEELEPGPESWYSRIHPDDMNKVMSGINKVIDTGGEQWSDEYRFRKADGSYAFILDRGYILHDEHGKSIRMLGSMVDITYMKEAQEALEQQAQELKQSNADLEQFAYISSHDLQEPLNTASSFAKLLAKKYHNQLGEDGNEFIHFIVNATDRMKLLIRSLLDYSKINSSGKMLEPTDMATSISQAQENLKATIMENAARITVGPMPVVQAIPLQMIQLWQNLISNAIKFRSATIPEIAINMREGENHYLFTLSDNGIGMDMKYSNKIFQVFQRLHSRDEYEGAGIGLATCKRIVERHGGLIWAESKPGKGSVFYFTIRK